MDELVLLQNVSLRARLLGLLGPSYCGAGLSVGSDVPIDVVVTLNEVNNRHGTGLLVKRIFQGRKNILSIRSRDDWGEQDFGDWNIRISQQGRSRHECFRNVLYHLRGRKIRSVVCIPFLADEILTAIAIHEAFGARLCAYIMDDQNISVPAIPNHLMREFLGKACLRLATHPELRDAYEQKYGLAFYLLPAVVPAALVATKPVFPAKPASDRRAALLGSFWDQAWFDRLCLALEGSGFAIDWFGNNRSPWLRFPPERLKAAGITPHGVLPEARLAHELRTYLFVIVPAGTLLESGPSKGVAKLSLPGRIIFAAAVGHCPILLVGSEQTCGARFVRHFKIGTVAPYARRALLAAMKEISDPENQATYRRNATRLGPVFSDAGVSDWLQESIRLGRPADNRFENAFKEYPSQEKPES